MRKKISPEELAKWEKTLLQDPTILSEGDIKKGIHGGAPDADGIVEQLPLDPRERAIERRYRDGYEQHEYRLYSPGSYQELKDFVLQRRVEIEKMSVHIACISGEGGEQHDLITLRFSDGDLLGLDTANALGYARQKFLADMERKNIPLFERG